MAVVRSEMVFGVCVSVLKPTAGVVVPDDVVIPTVVVVSIRVVVVPVVFVVLAIMILVGFQVFVAPGLIIRGSVVISLFVAARTRAILAAVVVF